MEVPDRDGLAGCARALRAVGHAAYAFSQVGGGRDVRTDAAGRAGEGRRGGRHRVAGVGRFHGRPGPPACCRGSKRGLCDPALGRSRGGLTSKVHLACDGRGRPLGFVVTGGNTNDCTQFTAVMDAIRVPRIGPGRPRVRPDHVLGDKGYSSKAIRTWLRRRGIPHTIPERADQIGNRARRGSRGGRPPAFDREAYKYRNVVERCFNRLKQWRGIATRYDKTVQSYEAAVTLASLLMWA
ncbi:IS5 family transposase [Streptomyces griseus]|nr:IS5 family transposase [Streptomyces griseus]PPA38262.1 IS5 family transposase [Streptomyces griseus]PPA44249.1 IS5 family transposase [Streptomyces griseus]